MSLHSIGRIGPIPLALLYEHTMVIRANAEPRFITEDDTTPLVISPCLPFTVFHLY